jgi:small subunit ribosomal protein S8
MSDPISDMLTRVRNGQAARKTLVSMPSSRMKEAIGKVLYREGYLDGCDVNEENGKRILTVTLRYYRGEPVIERLQRVSRPGRRMYCRSSDIPLVNNGLGVVIVSTSKGIMTGAKAKATGSGGELICTVA